MTPERLSSQPEPLRNVPVINRIAPRQPRWSVALARATPSQPPSSTRQGRAFDSSASPPAAPCHPQPKGRQGHPARAVRAFCRAAGVEGQGQFNLRFWPVCRRILLPDLLPKSKIVSWFLGLSA